MADIVKAIKIIYPEINGGFVYWNTRHDGAEWENPIDGLVWENEEYVKPTWEQIQEAISSFELSDAKNRKISEIKAIRDQNNILPITDNSAFVLDSEQNVSGRSVYFHFYADRHPVNPAADPTAILTTILLLNQALHYSTKTLDGEKITILLTPAIAGSIVAHLGLRNNNNYLLCNVIVARILAATTVEEVQSFTWNVSYLEE